MANLEQIMAETSKSYDNSRNALNQQISAIEGDLAAQKNRINAQYAQQAKSLDDQRNFQAQASSMAASNNGGSFGGSAEIANKKFYQQSYVPAVTQMQTNQSNDLSSAESQANSNRLSLQNALASLNDEATRAALSRYDEAVKLEEQQRQFNEQLAAQKAAQAQNAALQRQQIAAQNAYTNYLTQANQAANNYKYDVNTASPDGQTYYLNTNTGSAVRFGTYAKERGGNYKALLTTAASRGDNDSKIVLNYLNSHPNATISYMGGNGVQAYNNNSTLKQALNRLGIKVSGVK